MNDKISMQIGASPEPHEIETVNFLARKRFIKHIRFLAPNRHKGSRTPDTTIDGIKWEIKVPKGKSSRTIENNFRSAVQQAHHIIFDLRRTPLPDTECLIQLEKEFRPRKKIKQLMVITKKEKLLRFSKK